MTHLVNLQFYVYLITLKEYLKEVKKRIHLKPKDLIFQNIFAVPKGNLTVRRVVLKDDKKPNWESSTNKLKNVSFVASSILQSKTEVHVDFSNEVKIFKHLVYFFFETNLNPKKVDWWRRFKWIFSRRRIVIFNET